MTTIIHNKSFHSKPTSYEVAQIQNTWHQASKTSNIKEVIKALQNGKTIKFNTFKLDTIIIDADNPSQPLENYLNILEDENLTPTIAYSSFSANGINKHNFRLIYCFENITKNEYLNFTSQLEQLLDINLDWAFANNPKQICYGTNKQVYHLKQSNTITLNQTPFKPSLNAPKTSNTSHIKAVQISHLETLEYKDFINELNDILTQQKHISYDLTLRWYFANFNSPKIQQQIISLCSADTANKVLTLYKKNPPNYLLRLVDVNSHFKKIYLYNQKQSQKKQHLKPC